MGILGEVLTFLVRVAACGFLSLIVSAFFSFILAIAWGFAMIPVEMLAGTGVAKRLEHFGDAWGYRVVYAIVFFSMLLGAYGIRSVTDVFP
jgi:hypothetical protein